MKVGIRAGGWLKDWLMYSELLHDDKSPILWRAVRVFIPDYVAFPVEIWSNFKCDLVFALYMLELWSG